MSCGGGSEGWMRGGCRAGLVGAILDGGAGVEWAEISLTYASGL